MGQLKEILAQIFAYARLQVAVVAKLEEFEQRLYALEEHKKMKDTTIQNLQNDVHSLKIVINTGSDLLV